ncbi:MAG: hypothetical protein HN726_01090 [Candidatus Magasanikbacteria bacterium]|nr:hypothetical protein [Candidatus Magasanikbacteria bacterium]
MTYLFLIIAASAILLLSIAEISFTTRDLNITPFNYGNDQITKPHYQVTRTIIASIQSALVKKEDLSSIYTLSIQTQKDTLKQIYNDLPISGKKQFYDGATIQIDEKSPIKSLIKLRGDIDHHWRFPKKSFRLRSEKSNTPILFNADQVEVISPKGSIIIGEYITSFIGKKLDLIVPDHAFANVYLNKKFLGLYQVSEPIDRNTFLQRRNLPLGSILEAENISFTKKPGIGTSVFRAPFIWENSITHDQEEKHKQKLYELSLAIEKQDIKKLRTLIDYEYFIRLGALMYIGQIRHWDNRHNVKLYFNEDIQKFQQIPWDATFLTRTVDNAYTGEFQLDIISNDLIILLHKDPYFVQQKYNYIYNLLTSGITDSINDEISKITKTLAATQKHDYYSFYRYKKITPKIWQEKITILQKSINNSSTEFTKKIGQEQLCFLQKGQKLIIQVNGVSSHTITSIITTKGEEVTSKEVLSPSNKNMIFYPGRDTSNPPHAIPAPLSYQFILSENINISTITFKNTINKVLQTLQKNDNCPDNTNATSIHPWKLSPPQKNNI